MRQHQKASSYHSVMSRLSPEFTDVPPPAVAVVHILLGESPFWRQACARRCSLPDQPCLCHPSHTFTHALTHCQLVDWPQTYAVPGALLTDPQSH